MYSSRAFEGAPSLPTWCLLPLSAIFLLFIVYLLLRTRGAAARFVMFACWFRFMLSAFHEYSYREAAAGLTWIAFGSIVVVLLGLLVLDKRRFLVWPLAPVALICLLMLISSLLNNDVGLAVDPIVRFIYFAVICVGFWQALETSGPKILGRMLWVFVPVITFQLLSIILGVAKAGEADGSVSYIGGFHHEQAFSLILASCFIITCLATRIPRLIKMGLSLISLIGIYLANYRTTILGVAPLAITQMVIGIPVAFRAAQRPFILGAMAVTAAALLVVAATTQSERFADVGTVATHGTSLIKPPETFSRDDRKVLNGRVYLWSSYIYAYKTGDPLHRVIGFGPDSWTRSFSLYAHNTVISFLFELGIFGVLAIFLLWGSMLRLALRAPRGSRAKIVAAHLSFFMLNMATMPHWQIEGNILYGLVCGYTMTMARRGRPASAHATMRPAAPGRFGRHGIRANVLTASPRSLANSDQRRPSWNIP